MKKNKVKAEFLFKKGMKSELAMGIKRLYWGAQKSPKAKTPGKREGKAGKISERRLGEK